MMHSTRQSGSAIGGRQERTPITDGLFDCGEFISAMPEEFTHIAPLSGKKGG
ncbi:MAG TPA: hypothetical protein VH592_08600 [Gemmataceae bacterium]